MNIQIKLNSKNPAHAKLIDHLLSLGKNSGEAKTLLLQGFNYSRSPEANKITNITKADIDEIDLESMIG